MAPRFKVTRPRIGVSPWTPSSRGWSPRGSGRGDMSLADYLSVNDENLASRALATALAGDGRVLHHGFEPRLMAPAPRAPDLL
jgi:hypothetical protein